MCQVRLTSVDYAKFILLQANNNNHRIVDMMQLQHILFYIYGVFTAKTGTPLFDEIPQIWAFGVVFPNVYECVNIREVQSIPEEQRKLFLQNDYALNICVSLTKKMIEVNNRKLDEQFHDDHSLWGQFLYENQNEDGIVTKKIWGTKIKLQQTIDYFSQEDNLRYGNGE